MTEKRFIIDDCGTMIDMSTGDIFDYVSDVVECLNVLHKENKKLNDENEQLKRQLMICQDKVKGLMK